LSYIIIIISLLSELCSNLVLIESMHIETTLNLLRIIWDIMIRDLVIYIVLLEIRDSTNNRRYSHSTDADWYSIGISILIGYSGDTLVLILLLMRIIIWVHLLMSYMIAISILCLWRLQKLACISLFICYLYLLRIHFFFKQ
jgi:hypothetical protein